MKQTEENFPHDIEFVPVVPTPSINNSELIETGCIRPKDSENQWIVQCEPSKKYAGACINCREYGVYAHGYAKSRYVHDCNIGLTHVDLDLKVPRYRCSHCGKTFTYPFETIVPNTQFTKRLYEQVRTEALDYPIADVAKRHGISEFTVHSILKVYGAELDAQHHPAAPRILGIDEKHIAHKMRGVLVDIEHGKLLEMTKDNKRDDIISAIKSLNNYDKNIKYVTMDMSCGYASYVQELLPDALIVIDRFHVVQNIYKKTEKARKKIFVSLKERVAAMPEGEEKEQKTMLLKRLGKNSYLFKFGNGKLTEKESRISLMAELRETFPELDLLWRLRDAAENIYREADAECIDGYFADWEAMIPADPLFEDFWTLQRSMNRWKEQIFNYFYVRDELEECEEEDLRAPTNATTEGLNRLIDAINNSGFGYGFDILRIKCLYHTSAKDRPRKITKRVFSSRRSDFESFMSGGMTMNFVSTFSSLSMGRTEEVEEWVGGDGGSDIATLNELFEKGAI